MKPFKIWLAWQRKYFETGRSLLYILLYIVALFGLASGNVWVTMILGCVYAVLCYISGWLWVRYRMADAENIVANSLNPLFQKLGEKYK